MAELPPMSEPEELSELIDINVDYVPRSPYPTQRSEHGKGVADLRATFTVLEHMPDQFKIGLFAQPGTYDAIIRFSNGAKQNDSKRDTHGMAVKVLNVPMDTAPKGEDGVRFQDFIMLDCPIFVMGSLRNYIPFNRAFLEAKISVIGKLQLAWILLKNPRWIIPVLKLALNKANAPLSTPYWSTTPYQLGPHAVKYKAQPIDPPPAPSIDGENGRRDALRQQLKKAPGKFSFGILPQNNPDTQPIENTRIDWEEQGVSFCAMAEITISPDQVIDAPENMENDLTYSPGHAAAEHYPLGAINRARVAIYSAARRARLKAVAQKH